MFYHVICFFFRHSSYIFIRVCKAACFSCPQVRLPRNDNRFSCPSTAIQSSKEREREREYQPLPSDL